MAGSGWADFVYVGDRAGKMASFAAIRAFCYVLPSVFAIRPATCCDVGAWVGERVLVAFGRIRFFRTTTSEICGIIKNGTESAFVSVDVVAGLCCSFVKRARIGDLPSVL